MLMSHFDLTVSRLGVKARTFGGFGVMVALLALLGAIGTTLLEQLSNAVDATVSVSIADTAAGRIGQDVINVQVLAQTFLQSRNSGDIQAARQASTALQKTADEAADQVGASGGGTWQALKTAIGDQAQALAAAADAIDGERNAIGQLGSQGTNMSTVVDALVKSSAGASESRLAITAGRLQSAISGTRVGVTRFMLAHQPSDSDNVAQERLRVAAALSRLDGLTGNGPVQDALINDLRQKSDGYKAVLDGALAAAAARTKAEQALAAANLRLENAISVVKNDAATVREASMRRQVTLIASLRRTLLAVSAAAVVIGLLLAWVIARSIARPVVAMTETMQHLAGGDLDVAVPGTGHHDEIGRMAQALDVFRETAKKVRAAEASRKVLEQQLAREKQAELAALADHFETSVLATVRAVSETAAQVKSVSTDQVSTAESSSERAALVSNASYQVTTNVGTVAAATEQLSASIAEIASQSTAATTLVKSAVEQVTETSAVMRELQESSQRIGTVVELIQGIAGQTNLLALNATIEAARAGEMGKGFTVVASEVKALAMQTAKATKEIQEQIASMQSRTEHAGSSIDAMLGTVDNISAVTGTIAAAVQQQGAATQEISRNVQEVTHMTREVAENIALVSQASDVARKGAAATLAASATLMTHADGLGSKTAEFLKSIRQERH
jgi:methyl-accepting chemotaxis protein